MTTARITTLFWDLGGVVLTNAWGHDARQRAIDKFGLDRTEFEERHESVVSSFEKGQMGLEAYLQWTVFHRERRFQPAEFKAFMFQESQGHPDVLALAAHVRSVANVLMVVINNESTELNAHRIERFKLRDIFSFFISSCFVGLRKPLPPIYHLALEMTQRSPEECLFIDDRAPNLEPAKRLRMHTIHFTNAPQLRTDLLNAGVKID